MARYLQHIADALNKSGSPFFVLLRVVNYRFYSESTYHEYDHVAIYPSIVHVKLIKMVQSYHSPS